MTNPVLNIITRFSGEVGKLEGTLNSLREQTFKGKVKHIICCETQDKVKEVEQLNLLEDTEIIHVPKIPIIKGLFMYYSHHCVHTDYIGFDYKENKCEFIFNLEKTVSQLKKEKESLQEKCEAVRFENGRVYYCTLDRYLPSVVEHFPPNTYFNIAHQYVQDGWIYYIDTGDVLEDKRCLEDLSKEILNHDEDTLHVFKLMNRGRAWTTPQEEFMRMYKEVGYPLAVGECSGSCICFHSKYKEKIVWDEWRYGDYRVIKKLEKIIPKRNLFDRIILYTP